MKSDASYCTFYIVRHGETEWNRNRIVQGHSDIDLNELGIEQAKRTAELLKNIHFDLAISSDLLRAKRTAEIIALEHNLAVETTQLLRERSYGTLEGKPSKNLRAIEKILDRLSDEKRFYYKENKGFENDEELTTRFITFLREVAVANPEKTVLIVAHGGIMRAFLIRVGFWTYKNSKPIPNTSYVKVISDGVDFFVKELQGVE